MQYIALNATMIVPRDEGETRLVTDAKSSDCVEQLAPSYLYHARFCHNFDTREADFAYFEPVEEDLPDEAIVMPWTTWKRVTALVVGAAASWALVLGCVAMIRALL